MNIYTLLEEICDPEVPVLSILDLGIVRGVKEEGDEVEVIITPTYSGCPAMDLIATQIREKLAEHHKKAKITQVLSPAWTTDWLSEAGKRKLEEYGIAAPLHETADKLALMGQTRQVSCPQCKSTNTQMISQFGSTACKALFKCLDCLEPFDYFKCLK
ncbi:MAG: 1,2-phenylacetyl-CoA epoxidase subunit PaaD [Bacteroidia bacterium]